MPASAFDKLWTKLSKEFRGKITKIVLIVGALLTIFGALLHAGWPSATNWGDFARYLVGYLGAGVLAGGAANWLSNYIRAHGIVREELESIIFSPQGLERRSDVGVLWENATRALHARGFDAIAPQIYRRVKASTLPTNDLWFQRNGNRRVWVELVDRNRRIVKTTAHFTATVFPTCAEAEFRRPTSLTVLPLEGYPPPSLRTTVRCLETNEPIQVRSEEMPIEEDGMSGVEVAVWFPSDRSYRIENEFCIFQCLDDDNWNFWVARSIVDGMTWEVNYNPDDLIVQHRSIGNVTFRDVWPRKRGCIQCATEDLLLAGDGYMLSMQLVRPPAGTCDPHHRQESEHARD